MLRILYAGLLLLGVGCLPYSTLQTARVLEEGENMLGLGVSTFVIKDFKPPPILDIYYRRWIFRNADAGVRITGLPVAFGSLTVDLKYQFLYEPLYLSTSIGVILFPLPPTDTDAPKIGLNVSFCPALLLGSNRFNVGIKFIVTSLSPDYIIPVTFFNVAFGEKWLVIPEVNLVWIRREHLQPYPYPTIGIQRYF